MFFFFQAEDGIRDFHVTGVQTCALPIYDTVALDRDDGVARNAALAVEDGAGLDGDRKSVVWGKSVDLGGRRILKKKKRNRSAVQEAIQYNTRGPTKYRCIRGRD